MPTATGPAKKKRSVALIVGIALAALSVPCIGGLAAIAIPSFTGYLRRSKTAEATGHLTTLFQGAAAYYAEEHPMPDGTVLTGCTVDSAITPNAPSSTKSALGTLPPSFDALGFYAADPVYYQYEIVSAGGCGHPPSTPLYSFRAHGDLDGDGEQSLFELSAAGTSGGDELMRAPGIWRENELE
jgi:type II secretory pathway pseudopilin PulG